MNTAAAPIPAIDGVDTRHGLASVGANPAVYRRLLGVFCQMHADDAASMESALSAGQAEQAARIAHRLRGSASTLGLRGVELGCREFERAVHDGDLPEDLSRHCQLLAQVLRRDVSAIRAALESGSR